MQVDSTTPNQPQHSDREGLIDSESLLLNDERNPPLSELTRENYHKLIETYSESPGQFVSFVGAGLSRALGLDDWGTLLQKLRDDVCAKGATGLDRIDISEISPREYPAVAEQIARAYTSLTDRKSFHNAVAEHHQLTSEESSVKLMNLVRAISVHLTTNFDEGIARAYPNVAEINERFTRTPSRYYLPDVDRLPPHAKDALYYLHANIKDAFFILAEADYVRYYGSIDDDNSQPEIDRIRSCFQLFAKGRNLLFVGFSFDDIYVKKMMQSVVNEIKAREEISASEFRRFGKVPRRTETPIHFALVRAQMFDRITEAQFDDLAKYGIRPIYYTQHVFVDRLFKRLARIRKTKDASALL